MPESTLSDRIRACLAGDDPEALRAFHAAFLSSVVGLEVVDAPIGEPGSGFDASGMRLSKIIAPNGLAVIRAFADPAVFTARFGGRISAQATGASVLRMSVAIDGVAGVLVASAASEHSLLIPREQIPAVLVRDGVVEVSKPWWKLW